jgi:hypothetical protein
VNYLGRSKPISWPPTSKHESDGTQHIGKALKNENQKEIGNNGRGVTGVVGWRANGNKGTGSGVRKMRESATSKNVGKKAETQRGGDSKWDGGRRILNRGCIFVGRRNDESAIGRKVVLKEGEHPAAWEVS